MTLPVEKRLVTALGVAGLTLLALALRLAGIGYGLPVRLEPDAVALFRQVDGFWRHGESEKVRAPARAYPTLVARVASWLPDPRDDAAPTRDLDEHLQRAAAPFVTIRTAVALLSALIVPATWWLARGFVGPLAAFLAAALVAVSFLDLTFSQQCRPHAPAAAFAALAVAAALHMRRRPALSTYLVAGVTAGLAIGALQSGALVAGPLVAAHVLQDAPSGRRKVWLPLIALALTAAVAFVFYPKSTTPAVSPTSDPALGDYFVLSGHRIYYSAFQGAGFATLLSTLWSMENVTCVMATVGLAFWIARERRARFSVARHADLLVALAYVLPYFVIFGLYERTGERLAIQLVPFVACLAVFGWLRLRERLPLPGGSGALLAAVMIAVPAAGWIRWVVRREPNTAALAARWIAENVQPSERIQLVPPTELPLLRDAQSLAIDRGVGWASPWFQYQASLETDAVIGPAFCMQTWPLTPKAAMEAATQDPLGILAAQGTRYVVISTTDAPSSSFSEEMRAGLRAGARLVYRTPTAAGTQLWNPSKIWTWQLLGDYQPNGHAIEIYGIGG